MVCIFCFIFCGQRLFYAKSCYDDSHVHATAPCSALAFTQATPSSMSYIPLVICNNTVANEEVGL